MNANNMLSAKKTKLHGMKSSRWGTKEKITQYKGLVNLYARDKKILDADTMVERRSLKKEIRRLRKQITGQREELDNAVWGDRQELRNTLSENRNLQLAYQNMHSTRVIDVLYQENFNKRKLLDRSKYVIDQKKQKLINLKLEYALLQDRLKFEKIEKIPEEDMALVVTAKVQDAILKNQIAVDVNNTYTKILAVLKKDSIYFDAVLASLKIDGYNQGKCILKVTEMGQLATEYLDDRKQEYDQLEKILKKSMKERETSIKDVTNHLKHLSDNVKYLIRKDSLIELTRDRKSVHSHSEIKLTQGISQLKVILEHLKTTTVVANIEDIFPRMEDQLRQKIRLEELVANNIRDRDILRNKSNHAEQMYTSLCHTMVSTTFWYKEEKQRLTEEINEVSGRRKDTTKLITKRGELFMKVRTSLQQLAEILRNVAAPGVEKKGDKKGGDKKATAESSAKGGRKGAVKMENMPVRLEVDAMKLIQIITNKLNILLRNADTLHLDAEKKDIAIDLFQKFIDNMTDKSHVLFIGAKDESLLDYSVFEDPSVPSRFEIKARSAELCEKNAKTEFDVPVLSIKK